MNITFKEYGYDPEMEFKIGDIIITTDRSKHLLLYFLENRENDYDDACPEQIFKVLNIDTKEIKDYIKVILFEDDFNIDKVLRYE